MAPIAVNIHKQSKDDKLGIGLKGSPILISNIVDGSLFAKSGLLTVGMQLLSINNIPLDGMTSSYAIQLLKDAEGQVVVVADNPVAVQTAVAVNSTAVTASSTGRKFGYIILKKTFKVKPSGFAVAAEKSYSFHGPMTSDMVTYVNEKLQRLRLSNGANRLQFAMNNAGHFFGTMNHNAQKYHEEDFVCAMLEAMEELGYFFRFQYDAESFSTKVTGDSYTAKELFIFHRKQEGG